MNFFSPRALLFASIVMLTPLPLSAQSEEEPQRWFRVELLLFSQESATAANAEHWPDSPSLSYPEQYRFLVDPDRVAANLMGLEAESDLNDIGIQTITVLAEEVEETAPAPVIAKLDTVDTSLAPALDADIAAEELIPLTPSPFIALPSAELEFAGKAAYMKRRGNYEILFHETWVQPMVSRDQTLPIIIDRSGEQQNWPRLQGSVRIYLSRYLHLETQLWLNTQGSYLPGDWQMTPPPFGPLSMILIEPEPPEPEQEEELPWYEDNATAVATGVEDLPEEETGPVSPWRHAVLLQEKRKMRSTEVHYLDHPLLGAVIKILPVDKEELETRALAEYEANK